MMPDFQAGTQVGQALSEFTKYAYVVKYLIKVCRYFSRSKVPKKHLMSYVNAMLPKEKVN